MSLSPLKEEPPWPVAPNPFPTTQDCVSHVANNQGCATKDCVNQGCASLTEYGYSGLCLASRAAAFEHGSWSPTTASEGVKQSNQGERSLIFCQDFSSENFNNFDEKICDFLLCPKSAPRSFHPGKNIERMKHMESEISKKHERSCNSDCYRKLYLHPDPIISEI